MITPELGTRRTEINPVRSAAIAGCSPEVMSDLDIQQLMDALIQWRVGNPWASALSWDEFPDSVRNEVEALALLLKK